MSSYRPGSHRIPDWVLLCTLGLALAKLLALPGIPAAAMLGPLIIAVILGLRGSQIRVPPLAASLSHAVVGCLIAVWLEPAMVAQAVSLWPLIVIFVTLTFVAADLSGPAIIPTGIPERTEAALGDGALIAAILASGVAASRWLRFLPAAATLVPLLLTTALAFGGTRIAMPDWMVSLAFLGIGAGVGLRFTLALLRLALRALPALTLACAFLIVLCAASGLVLAWAAGVSPLTGILSTGAGQHRFPRIAGHRRGRGCLFHHDIPERPALCRGAARPGARRISQQQNPLKAAAENSVAGPGFGDKFPASGAQPCRTPPCKLSHQGPAPCRQALPPPWVPPLRTLCCNPSA